MVTSCKWQRLKVLTPDGDASKVIYFIGQSGRQQLEQGGKTVTTAFSTQASRLEFVTIKEALQAQRPPQEEELVAQFVACEEELLEGALRLKPPFHPDNVSKMELVVSPFVVFYFALFQDEEEGPVVAVPVSLFNGQIAPKLLQIMREFPLSTKGVPTIISPNISLDEAFQTASQMLEEKLSNPETGRSSLIWCDTAQTHEKHRRTRMEKGTFSCEHLQWEESQHQVLGLQPIEYINAVLLLVPHLLLSLRDQVHETTIGLLDPVLQNVYLMPHISEIQEI
ncbi:MAG: hypothetical protein GX033_08025 [Firmicutes bacterium]|nr:hypothetical protein [Bacillota bacterium]